MNNNLQSNIHNEILINIKKNATPENAMMEHFNQEKSGIDRKKYVAKLNEIYTHFKLFLNAAVVSGVDEVSSDPNNIFHIEKVKESVFLLRKAGFSNVIINTLEEYLFNRISFFSGSDLNERNYFKSYYQNINLNLSKQQKTQYKENIEKEIGIDQVHISSNEIEINLSNENQALLTIFKVIFLLCNGIEIGLIGRSLRNYFKTRYPFNNIGDESQLQAENMMNLPLFLPKKDLGEINLHLQEWIKIIRNEQLKLCNITKEESTKKILEIGIDDNLSEAINQSLDKLPILNQEQLGLSLNQIKGYIKNDELWDYFYAGLTNYYNNQILFN